ncbi:major head protein [Pseudomonas phage EL]|uniref:Uncharacterized protein n=2 Tax=root TaxID=1 RepID=Q2Z103_9CAUD|nr:major head protein [Pseudomonas phage EL]CAG27172.1 hypothetical protein [Pseudomonas phage EL]
MAKQLRTSINGDNNLFSDVCKSLVAGSLSNITGNESFADFRSTLQSAGGQEGFLVNRLIGRSLPNVSGNESADLHTGFNSATYDIVQGILERKSRDLIPMDCVRIFQEAGDNFAKVEGAEGFSMQNFEGREQEIRAANLTLNAQSHLQTEGAEALFATVGVRYQDEGAELIVRAAGLGTYAYGNTPWQSASELRPIFGLLRSGDMFKDEALAVYPVYPDDNASEDRAFFVAESVIAPRPVKYAQGDAYGRGEHETQMLAVPVSIPNLLALTQAPGQRPWNSTDELESNSISVSLIAASGKLDGTDISFFIKTGAMSNNTFAPANNAQTSDERQLNLQVKQLPGFSVSDKDGKVVGETIFASFKSAGYEPLLAFRLTGSYQRQTNEFNLQPGTVTITAVRNITTGVVTKIGFADSTVKALMRSFTEGKLIGAITTQNVSNTNRGNFGYRIEVYDAKKHLSVKRRSPISVKYPISADDVNQASLDFALSQMSVVINNQCSAHAFQAAEQHLEYVTSITGQPVVANDQGSEVLAGQHFVSPIAINRSFKLVDVISANSSSDVFVSVASAITNEIADIVAALNTKSGLASIAEYSTGNTKNAWTVVVHQNLSRFIFRSGDARTIGPINNLKVVETNFDSMIGKMYIVPTNDSNNETINPLAGIGVLVSKENVVVQGNITRDNSDFGVVMTLPSYKHWPLNVVIGSLVIEDAEDLLSDKGLINQLAVKRVKVENIEDAKPDPNAGP